MGAVPREEGERAAFWEDGTVSLGGGGLWCLGISTWTLPGEAG